jgi:hypothetical protein
MISVFDMLGVPAVRLEAFEYIFGEGDFGVSVCNAVSQRKSTRQEYGPIEM